MLNTLKTTWGFLLTLIEKNSPFKFSGENLEDIYNYLPISETLSTSGQPTARQFCAIRDAGFTTVINLLPQGIENALDGEADLVTSLGMNYIHIPVAFFSPTDDNFNTFAAQMNRLQDEKIWVHCAANGRASAFIYRYRTTILKENPESVKWDVREIWEPFGVWKTFMNW